MTDAYVVMCADVVHHGHVNLLRQAAQYGRVVVGLLSDEAAARYKRVPFMTFEERREVVAGLRWVDEVVRQDEPSPVPYIERLRPRYFLHGDDWRSGSGTYWRELVVAALDRYGGRLVEIPYTQGVSSTSLQARLRSRSTGAGAAAELRRLLQLKPGTAAVALAGTGAPARLRQLQAEGTAFDAIWFGCPAEAWGLDLNLLFQVVEAAGAPVLVDGRSQAGPVPVAAMFRQAARLGAAGLCLDIRDLTGQAEKDWTDAGLDMIRAVFVPAGLKEPFGAAGGALLADADLVMAAPEALAELAPLISCGGGWARPGPWLGGIFADAAAAAEEATPHRFTVTALGP